MLTEITMLIPPALEGEVLARGILMIARREKIKVEWYPRFVVGDIAW